MLFCFDKFCYKLAKLCDVAVLVKWRKPNGIYPYLGFPFAITNHLGDALFRSFAWKFALCTASTLQLASTQNLRKIAISKARSVFACVTAR